MGCGVEARRLTFFLCAMRMYDEIVIDIIHHFNDTKAIDLANLFFFFRHDERELFSSFRIS